MSELIIDTIREYLEGLLKEKALELFDIQFRREGHGWVLRIFIDNEDGISLEHCRDVSREVSYYLDVEDIIDHAYSLEVSSPGLERPLRSVEDFLRFVGKKARVKFHDAIEEQKVFDGVIEKVVDEIIYLKLENEEPLQFSYEMLNKARLTI